MLQPKKPVKKYVPTAKEKKNLKDAKEQKNMRPPFTSEERKKMPRVGSMGTAKNGKNIKKAKTGTSLGMKSVKAGYDKNPGVTRADIITAATKKAKTGTIIPKKNSVSKNVGNLNKAKFGDMLGKAAGSGMFGLAGIAANKLFGDKKKTGGTVKKCMQGCK